MSRAAEFWDLYADCDAARPRGRADRLRGAGPAFAAADATPATTRHFDITDEDVRRSRRAYFANISYVDEKIGELLDALDAHAAWRTTPSSSSSPTTATCSASAACGSR